MLQEPDIETLPWPEQRAKDDTLYREQLRYLYGRSRFFREKLQASGFASPEAMGGLNEIGALPLTEKDELRQSRSEADPIGTHLAAPLEDVVRIFSTSGTTGLPSYIPLTAGDLDNWIRTSARSYGASGLGKGERIVSTYNAGPFVAGAALDAFPRLGLCHIPVGTGNTERLLAAVKLLKPQILACTPSYALHLAEIGEARGLDLRNSSIKRIMVAGEPGGGEPAMREKLEEAWNAKVTEAMGIGDISVSLWGECEEQHGMHFSGRGFVHFELIDPDTGKQVPVEDGAKGELVYTHLKHRGAPLLRFRSRDHVVVWTSPCSCGRTAPRVRCIGRTDDMLIVRGVNVFPSAIREIVNRFAPAVTGVVSVRPTAKGVKQAPPLKVVVELAEAGATPDGLRERIEADIRATLVVTTAIHLVPPGTLPRSEYKSRLLDFSEASAEALDD
ncbi:phenylacetate--CoA ligase family protein [Bosea sp. NBC_00550]|uniref:phenylacetate--CoA ligase family protein n=1 Tax=Bosea sp. NBC_00550 TaxID=2969621 RepID=UPI0029FF1392|nr:AMP-binding protein [Bosea sp. NBC_00550]